MDYIVPLPEQLKAFSETVDDDTPIIMINLLKFRNRANYPADSGFAPCTGREAYQRYIAAAGPIIEKLGGGLHWIADVKCVVIGPLSESWDEALLVKYPTRKSFIDMVAMPEYQKAAVHRTAAVQDSRLIETVSQG
jgi:uncharacterized protein (DUF1330 family)